MLFDDTIAAISTAQGVGAIAIVRMSGADSWQIASKFFSSAREQKSAQGHPGFKCHKAVHGFVKDLKDAAFIDEVVIIPYKSPNSYTGEDLIEINCHGGPIVTRAILDLCLAGGARLARQGEFTQRAFLNGRLDLTQAEAVLDIIQAKTSRQSRLAVSGLKGHLGRQILEVRTLLVDLLGRVVAGIDFPEEVGEMPLSDVDDIVRQCALKLSQLSKTARAGRFLREGLKLAIVGKPNAGKSSLLNQLLKFERAIVTEIPGTTRDSLEEMLDLNGIPITLIDTAGIRASEDVVEQIGIERSRKAIEEADLVLFVLDAARGLSDEDALIARIIERRPHFLLANKIDLEPQFQFQASERARASIDNVNSAATASTGTISPSGALAQLKVSATQGTGIDQLSNAIEGWVFADQTLKDAGAALNSRQSELCEKAIKALSLVEETSRANMPQDCLATDLKTAIDSLSEICGEAVSEEVIANVFANFCIGK